MKRVLLAMVASLAFGTASATEYDCIDTVHGVLTSRGGTVVIESFAGSSWLTLCSLTTTDSGVSPDQCKTVYPTLLAAQLSGQAVRLWFNDNLTCATQPGWTEATGWYYGPEIMPGP